MKPLSALVLLPLLAAATDCSVETTTVDGIEVVRLLNPRDGVEVSVVPSIGNIAYQMKVNGKNLFWFPFASLAEFRKRPVLAGNPFLAPWANRFDQDALHANGKKYTLNPALGNLRRDPNKNPIHGLLLFSPHWKVVNVVAGDRCAEYVARLEFWRHPDLMAQFPFAHTIEMIHRLKDGVLEVETIIHNHAAEPMPVPLAFTRTSGCTIRREMTGRCMWPRGSGLSCPLCWFRQARWNRSRCPIRRHSPEARSTTCSRAW